jgi:predicted nucleic acid-binding protein
MASDVLVDSNVYIDLLRARRDPVSMLFEWSDRADLSLVICGMIRLEVLRGITALRARHKLSAFMDVMINVPTDNQIWADAADLAWKLDRQGRYLPGPDVIIASCALRIGAAVMTADAHFRHIDGLTVIVPPAEWTGRPE